MPSPVRCFYPRFGEKEGHGEEGTACGFSIALRPAWEGAPCWSEARLDLEGTAG